MPPSPQKSFAELKVAQEGPASASVAINDSVYTTNTEPEALTQEQIETKIQGLRWLIAPGNGATKEALEKFTAKLAELEEQLKQIKK